MPMRFNMTTIYSLSKRLLMLSMESEPINEFYWEEKQWIGVFTAKEH